MHDFRSSASQAGDDFSAEVEVTDVVVVHTATRIRRLAKKCPIFWHSEPPTTDRINFPAESRQFIVQ